jgi:hypothetical protein
MFNNAASLNSKWQFTRRRRSIPPFAIKADRHDITLGVGPFKVATVISQSTKCPSWRVGKENKEGSAHTSKQTRGHTRKEFFLIRIGCEQPFRIVEHLQHSPYEVCVLCQNDWRSWLTVPTKNIFFDRIRGRKISFEDLGYLWFLVRDTSFGIIYRLDMMRPSSSTAAYRVCRVSPIWPVKRTK